jgi:hypothetical protein
MDHDWMDWDDGEPGFSDDLASAETADLGGDTGDHPLPEVPDDEQPWFASEDAPDDYSVESPGLVDAHVDEPLHDFDLPSDDGPDDLVDIVAAPPEPTFGADPDGLADAYEWADPAFPPSLDLGDLPVPVDGPPWTDPDLLGVAPLGEPAVATSPVDAAELYGYAALDAPAAGDPWAALVGSDDPATSALARWWSPS